MERRSGAMAERVRIARLALSRQQVAVVDQMGKVGSNSVHRGLLDAGIASLHTHGTSRRLISEINDHYDRHGIAHFDGDAGALLRPVLPVARSLVFVSIFREPIERNLSAYAQNFRPQDLRRSGPQLVEAFVDDHPHWVPDRFVELEIEGKLGVRLAEHPLGPAQRARVAEGRHGPVVLFRIDLPDEEKSQLLSEVFGTPVHVGRLNVAEGKRSADSYRRLFAAAAGGLPPALVDTVLDGVVARCTMSTGERAAARARWSAA